MGGSRGPVAAPPKLRVLEGRGNGTDSGGRPVAPPPTFRRVAPKPPTHLSREAKAEWNRVVPELRRLDLLKAEDRAALTAYCETWATYCEAKRQVRAPASRGGGIVVINRSIRKDGVETTWMTKNPAVAVMENAGQQLIRFAREFGLTPSSEGELVGEAGRGDQTPLAAGDNPFA